LEPPTKLRFCTTVAFGPTISAGGNGSGLILVFYDVHHLVDVCGAFDRFKITVRHLQFPFPPAVFT
jgi:hypothetical protein